MACVDPSEHIALCEHAARSLDAESENSTGQREDLDGVEAVRIQWDANPGADAARPLVDAIDTGQAFRQPNAACSGSDSADRVAERVRGNANARDGTLQPQVCANDRAAVADNPDRVTAYRNGLGKKGIIAR
jgi:hypothetical protein